MKNKKLKKILIALLDLTVVIVVIGILVSTILPKFIKPKQNSNEVVTDITSDSVQNEESETIEIKQQVKNTILYTNGEMIEVKVYNAMPIVLSDESAIKRQNVQRLYERSPGLYLQDGKLKINDEEINMKVDINDDVFFDGDSSEYISYVMKENKTIYVNSRIDGVEKSVLLDDTLTSYDRVYFSDLDCYVIAGNVVKIYTFDFNDFIGVKTSEKTYLNGVKDIYAYEGKVVVLSNKNEVYVNGEKN